jgi:uncharacterized protein
MLSPSDLRALPIFPLPNAALFPGCGLPLHVFEPRYRDLVRDVLLGNRAMAVARLKPGFEENYAGRPAVFEVCGAGTIVDHRKHDDGRYDILLRGVSRIRILNEHAPLQSYRLVNGELLSDAPTDSELANAFHERLRALWPALSPHLPEAVRELGAFTRGTEGVGELSDRLAGTLFAEPELTQRLIAELDPAERMRIVTDEIGEIAERLSARSSRTMN